MIERERDELAPASPSVLTRITRSASVAPRPLVRSVRRAHRPVEYAPDGEGPRSSRWRHARRSARSPAAWTYSATSGLPDSNRSRPPSRSTPVAASSVRDGVADVRRAADRLVEELAEGRTVAGDRRAALGVEVDLGASRVLTDPVVDPSTGEPAGVDVVLGRADHAIPGQHRGADHEHREHRCWEGKPESSRKEHDRGEREDHETREQLAPGREPRPAPGTRSRPKARPAPCRRPPRWPAGERAGRRAARARGRRPSWCDQGSRQPVGEPDGEDDEPSGTT